MRHAAAAGLPLRILRDTFPASRAVRALEQVSDVAAEDIQRTLAAYPALGGRLVEAFTLLTMIAGVMIDPTGDERIKDWRYTSDTHAQLVTIAQQFQESTQNREVHEALAAVTAEGERLVGMNRQQILALLGEPDPAY